MIGILAGMALYPAVPDSWTSVPVHFFIMNHKRVLYWQTWFWLFSFYFAIVTYSYWLWRFAPTQDKREFTAAFFFIQLFHAVEWFLNYDSVGFMYQGWHFSSQMFTTLYFGFVITNDPNMYGHYAFFIRLRLLFFRIMSNLRQNLTPQFYEKVLFYPESVVLPFCLRLF